jgi:hypothetical protein
MAKQIRKRHVQHTKGFARQLFGVNSSKPVKQPFRTHDGIMVVGKHKDSHISVVPSSYLRWMLDTMEMTALHRLQLQNQINKHV